MRAVLAESIAHAAGPRYAAVFADFRHPQSPLPVAHSPLPLLTLHPVSHRAIYPGSFDPVTFGHLDVIARGRRLFDEVIVGVGRNPGKDSLFTAEERVEMIETLVGELVAREPGAPVSVRAFTVITVVFAVSVGGAGLLLGVRSLSEVL
jgi:pantetheine-phosphate adenylyltransferase